MPLGSSPAHLSGIWGRWWLTPGRDLAYGHKYALLALLMHRHLKPCDQGASPQFPGVLVGPPHVRKCHQMSSKEHIQLGWVVRWVLSTPPGHPTAGRCVRVVPVLPVLLCTRPARARPSIGGQSPTPAPRQLPWSPPRGWCSFRLPHSTLCSLAHIRPRGSKSRPETMYCLAALHRVGKASPVADEVTGGWRMGLLQTSSKTEATCAFLWLVSPHLK
jgi:hypothetical protein